MNEHVQQLFAAIKEDEADRAEALVAANPELVRARSENGQSPLLLAAYSGKAAIVAMLLRRGAEPDLFEAAAVGAFDAVRTHVEAQPERVNAYAHDGFTPLGLASFFGHGDIAAWLLDRGADVNAASRNAMRVAPLHSAAAHRHIAIARLLIAHGADVNARQHGGWTPLHAAAHNGQLALAELLLAHGADAGAANDAGATALTLAEAGGHAETAALLRRHAGGS